MLTQSEIKRILTEELDKRSEIVFAYLFGSVVDAEAFGDIDVGVYVSRGAQLDDGFDYAVRLSRDLERLLGCPVDVILMNNAPDHLIHSISKGRVIIDRDEDARVDFITASWSRYFDIQQKRRQAVADMLS